jgi:hypothetical protein
MELMVKSVFFYRVDLPKFDTFKTFINLAPMYSQFSPALIFLWPELTGFITSHTFL